MHSLTAVLNFILLNEMTIEQFEDFAKLRPGTLTDAYEISAELSNADLNRIIARYGRDMMDLGFIICPLGGWPGNHNDYMIIENDLNMMFFGDKELNRH